MSLIKRLRFAADVTTEKIGENLLTTAAAHLLKPSACQFEVTLLESSSALLDIADLDQLTLSVKLNDPRTGLALMQKTVASGALNKLLTWEDFQTGGAANCHAVFTFSAAETNLELDAVEQQFYLVIEGVDTGGNEVAFADGIITIEESGAFAAAPAAITADHFYTQEQSDARYLLSADLTGKVDRSGDTMTGALSLSGAPSASAHATTKSYVDTQDATKQAVLTGAATTIASADLTASRVVVSNGSGKVAVSAVTATELGYVSGVTSALQTQLAAKQATITGGATTIATSNLTTSRALASDTSGKVAASAVTATELGYVAGVTSALQTQLDAKGPAITGGASTIATSNLTASRALASDASGKVAVSAVTATELGYVAGLTSALQTQLDARLTLSGGTMTGALTLSGDPSASSHAARKSYVDTADALKLNLTGGTLSGALQFSGSTNAGMRVNNLTSTQITALGAVSNGYVVYDSTLNEFRFREASVWKSLGGAGAGTGWLSGTLDPDNGDGADGDYYLQDTGAIWLKTSGAWAVFVAARLPLSGGAVTGAVSIDNVLTIQTGATLHTQIDSGGIGVWSGVYAVNGYQVVGERISTWSAPTGTQDRTTFDTATVTLEELAQRFLALLTDLGQPSGPGLINV